LFHGDTVDALPDPLVSVLIAHELAHAYLFARADSPHMAYIHDENDDTVEDTVRSLMMEWGWDVESEDEDALDEWLGQLGDLPQYNG
jgi:predicted SpoU family rRNA methylase